MAKVTTKKKTSSKEKPSSSKKPATTKKATETKDDEIDDLIDSLDAELEEDGEATPPTPPPAKKKEEKPSVIGRTVRLVGEDEDGVETEEVGKIVSQDPETGEIQVETADAFYNCELDDVELIEEEPEPEPEPVKEPSKGKSKSSGKGKSSSKSKPAKKAEPAPANTEDDASESVAGYFLMETSDVKIPKVKVRDVDKESKDYKKIFYSIKKYGQRDPIKIDMKKNLVEGLRRVTICEDLGIKVLARYDPNEIRSQDDRLFFGLIDNEARESMHWSEIAKTVTQILKGGKYKQGEVARSIGLDDSQISRLIATCKLPDEVIEISRSEEGGKPRYSQTVFEELASAPKAVVDKAFKEMKDGGNMTVVDIRALKKEAKKASKDKKAGKDGDGDGGDGDGSKTPPKPPARSYTYRDISAEDIGDLIKLRVHRDGRISVSFDIQWDKKTFSGFDPNKELKSILDETFSNEGCSVSSLTALRKKLKAAKSELPSE